MEYGTIRIKLDELLKESGLSKNMLSHRAEMQRTQINNYCRNQITRLDIDVLGRLCTVLNCEIGDLLEFVPPEEKKERDSQERVDHSVLRVFLLNTMVKLLREQVLCFIIFRYSLGNSSVISQNFRADYIQLLVRFQQYSIQFPSNKCCD